MTAIVTEGELVTAIEENTMTMANISRSPGPAMNGR
jgi:hypothetical protein